MSQEGFNKKVFLQRVDNAYLAEYFHRKLRIRLQDVEGNRLSLSDITGINEEQKSNVSVQLELFEYKEEIRDKIKKAIWDLIYNIFHNNTEEEDVDHILSAIESCPQPIIKEIEQDFNDIHFLASKPGIQHIIKIGKVEGIEDLNEKLDRVRGLTNKVMWFFLNYPEYFDKVYIWFEIDKYLKWCERRGFATKQINKDNIDLFKEKISKHYYQTEGRGKHCHVDVYDQPDRVCLYVYPEDYTTIDLGFSDEGAFKRSYRKSAFKNIFVFYFNEGLLRIKAKGGKSKIQPMQVIFASTLLDQDIPLDPGDQKVFNLNLLRRRNFNRPTPPEDKVESVNIKMLRMEHLSNKKVRIEIDAPNEEVLYNEIKERGLELDMVNITSTRITVKYPGNGNRGGITFNLSSPDRCNLGNTEQEKKVRQYLIDWGIDGG